jgi:ABC-type dipeptide/oligopeptide/nickel transport system permease subunit
MGKHQALQSAADAITTAWLSYALRLIYQLVLGTTKLGICMFYLRVFKDRTSQILVFSMIAFICLFTVPLEIYVAVRCRQVDPLVSNSLTCVRNTPDLYLFAICSIVSDVLLVMFVVPRVRE